MLKKSRKQTTTLIVCEVQPGRTQTMRQSNYPISVDTATVVEGLVTSAAQQKWNVILLEDAMRSPTFGEIAARLPKHRRNQRVVSYFDDAERGIVLNECARVELALLADRIILCGAGASVHEVAATLFILPEQNLEIIQMACSGKICRKEIMRQRRRSGRDLTTGFQIKPQL